MISKTVTQGPGKTLSSIVWNEDNKPVTITTSTGTVTFMYDGNGNRVKKTKGSNTTYYYGDAYEKRNTIGIIHLFANDKRLASIRTDNKNQYYHGNHLGSASVITDSTGNLKQKIEYMPYGTYRYGTSPDQQMGTYDYDTSFPNANYTFTDQEDDDETGLYNYGARLYDPEIGRFISADSIVPRPDDLQSLNRYSYCSNNPLVYVDPSGHFYGDAEGFGGDWTGWYGSADDAAYNTGVEVGEGANKAGVVDVGQVNGIPENISIDTTYLNQIDIESSPLYDFLFGLFKSHKNDAEDEGNEKGVMYARNDKFMECQNGARQMRQDISEVGKGIQNFIDQKTAEIGQRLDQIQPGLGYAAEGLGMAASQIVGAASALAQGGAYLGGFSCYGWYGVPEP
jgi:RHS repeat-associated protein